MSLTTLLTGEALTAYITKRFPAQIDKPQASSAVIAPAVIEPRPSVNTKPTITVRIRDQYGMDVIYPHCPVAHIFASMVGQKTLTKRDIGYIKDLGYSVIAAPLAAQEL